MSLLEHLGWNGFFDQQVTAEWRTRFLWARIVAEQRGLYRIAGDASGWHRAAAGTADTAAMIFPRLRLCRPQSRKRRFHFCHVSAAGNGRPALSDAR